MTRKDYVLIANIIKEVGDDEALSMDSGVDRVRLAHQFAAHLATTNPLFSEKRFVEAATNESDRQEYEEADGSLINF